MASDLTCPRRTGCTDDCPDDCEEHVCGRDVYVREHGEPTAFEETEPEGPVREVVCPIHDVVASE